MNISNVTLLLGDRDHPIRKCLEDWVVSKSPALLVSDLVFEESEVPPETDIVFLISYPKVVDEEFLSRFPLVIVLHASDLPTGRGWSPYIWEILNGAKEVTVCAITATERVDEGDIWAKVKFPVLRSDTVFELNKLLFSSQLQLIDCVIEGANACKVPVSQDNRKATYYPRRRQEDSIVSSNKTIDEIFNLLRISDPIRYPVLFYKHGECFKLILEKVNEDRNKR